MILEHSDYRSYLKSVFARRVVDNNRYSLRAFARDLGVSAAFLSVVLSNKRKLSIETALKFSDKLGLISQETEYFSLLVQFESAKGEEGKSRILDQMVRINAKRKPTDLSLEVFKVISDWYHFAILMLTEVESFDFEVDNIANRLNISRHEAETAIKRLLELEMLVESPKGSRKFRRAKGDLLVGSKIPNSALRKHHRQLLEKSIESLETQTPQEKLIGTEMIAISKSQLPEANKIMEEFFHRMLKLSRKKMKKTDVYHVGVQIFNLSKPKGNQ